jgi:hypothetical protein
VTYTRAAAGRLARESAGTPSNSSDTARFDISDPSVQKKPRLHTRATPGLYAVCRTSNVRFRKSVEFSGRVGRLLFVEHGRAPIAPWWLGADRAERARATVMRLETGSGILHTPNFHRDHREAERASRSLNFTHIRQGDGIAGIGQNR